MHADDTIIAQTTAQGSASRGIVRLSGNTALDAATMYFLPGSDDRLFSGETFTLKNVDAPCIVEGQFKPWGSERPFRTVRCALFYWPKGRGFTGEQAVELHLPGSAPILNAAIRSICSTGLARLAERGEFTLRAFLNGRLDLTQAEAILGAIEASSDRELKNALLQLSGTLSRRFADLRNQLLNVLTELEAGFDFTDEDIEFISFAEVRDKLRAALDEVKSTLRNAKTQLSHDRFPRVTLIGRPNVGKSSLFNALVDKFNGRTSGKALVSEIAGTTRDYLEAEFEIDGVRFTLVDSAGFEKEILAENSQSTTSAPRELAQFALLRALDQTELVVRCFESPKTRAKILEETAEISDKKILDVITKSDRSDSILTRDNILKTSATTGFGIKSLGYQIAEKLQLETKNSEVVPSTALRCQESLRGAQESLEAALSLLDNEALCDESLVASELRLALNQIGLITGQLHTDDLLDSIFSRFCIGK
ncbi:MAG: tRNA modification GTPase [Thermoguttaceae bacterium]|jgi:tRNA modification GTPase